MKRRLRHGVSLLLAACITTSTFGGALASAESAGYKIEDFANVLDVTARLDNEPYGYYSTSRYNAFSDMGAWHGYHLHALDALSTYGGFAGPHIIVQDIGMNLSDCISRLELSNADGTKIDLTSARPYMAYYPGRLMQYYEVRDAYKVTLELIFVSGRTNLVRAQIENYQDKPLVLNVGWSGRVFAENKMGTKTYPTNVSLGTAENGVQVSFAEGSKGWTTTPEMKYTIRHSEPVSTQIADNKLSYVSKASKPVTITKGKPYITYTTESFTFTKAEADQESKTVQTLLANPEKAFADNRTRWEGYLNKTFDKVDDVAKPYKNATVKAMETLITNWRSPAGMFQHSGLTPSMSYKWFNGVWGWDTWKNAAGIAAFDPELAKDGIRCMFDYQIQPTDPVRPQDAGTIFDCFSYPEDSGNYRNSKPPLSAWGVWKVYQESKDKAFLNEMYPKLTAYHNWWYTNRDTDQNGVAEYGAMVDDLHYQRDDKKQIKKDKDGKPLLDVAAIIEAAAWESGMDNATRFDQEGSGKDDIGVQVFENTNKNGKVIGYSINQESVDLNAMLYAEKAFLKSIALEIGKTEDAKKYESEAKKLAEYINENMWDEKTGFYYDLQISKDGTQKKLLTNRGKGTEGWMPLWAKLAPENRAQKVKDNMMDAGKFNLRVPMPTASADNAKFNPYRYWRGPVWLDQALYGVEALQNYGYEAEAKTLAYKLFDGAEGLLTDGPIHENYNPVTGEGLHTKNFSWSAAAYYMLYQNALAETNPSTQTGIPIK